MVYLLVLYLYFNNYTQVAMTSSVIKDKTVCDALGQQWMDKNSSDARFMPRYECLFVNP